MKQISRENRVLAPLGIGKSMKRLSVQWKDDSTFTEVLESLSFGDVKHLEIILVIVSYSSEAIVFRLYFSLL
jgi:hypothetical protein